VNTEKACLIDVLIRVFGRQTALFGAFFLFSPKRISSPSISCVGLAVTGYGFWSPGVTG
jgi:hypothetical protein